MKKYKSNFELSISRQLDSLKIDYRYEYKYISYLTSCVRRLNMPEEIEDAGLNRREVLS